MDPVVADEIAIRPASGDDIAGVLALWVEADAHPSRTDDAASLRQLIASQPGALLVAESRGRVVGSVIAGWDGWRGSIYRLAVAPGYRRQGLARSLVAAAEQRLAERGAVRMQAIVVDTDAHAIGFWQAVGWERQVEQARFVKG